jgi:DNA-binding LacI/PurR family transcriptional regulator
MIKLADVAELAGVSASTVSRVVNEPERVRAETRTRVESAIRRLGYRPSRVARRLRVKCGRSTLIGLVIPDLQNPFFADLARGVEDAAQQEGYTVLIGNADEDPEKERRYLQVMGAESVDGVILPPAGRRSPAAEELLRGGTPVVCVDRRLPLPRVDVAVIDNVRGAYAATAHLIANGHRRIGFIHGTPHLSTSRERLQGYRDALADHDLQPDPALTRSGDSRQASGKRLTAELLRQSPRPTALLVGNSMMTLGALESIREARLAIPTDLALVGYDDMPWALALDPPLTVVRQPGYELGARAAELLLQRIRDPARSTTVVMLQPELVIRRSSGVRRPSKAAEKKVVR